MYAFFEYVLYKLKSGLNFAHIAGIAAVATLSVTYALYRLKHKGERKFPWAKALLLLAFVGYVAVVFHATILRSGSGYRSWNTHLFRAWREAWNNYTVQHWANVLLNVALFVPLGIMLPLLCNHFRKWYLTIPTGLFASAIIELIQLAICIGICDVDDLFTNTLGTTIGFLFIMSVLALFKERGNRLKPCFAYSALLLTIIVSISSIFVVYELQEYGNLPMAAAYRNNTKNTAWTLSCELPAVDTKLPVYRAKKRSLQDCDEFAEYIAALDGTTVDMVDYYQDFAYYMLHTDGSGSGVLLVSYYDESYEYSISGSKHDISSVASDRETIVAALSKYPICIPECADYYVDEGNWHIFTVNKYIDGTTMFDGSLRIQYLEDGTLRKIENYLLSYTFYRSIKLVLFLFRNYFQSCFHGWNQFSCHITRPLK